ncbi:TIGR03032 family protein [Ahniella affigens]|uniref:TIGR03032 family protein n=1 Tax=Ahniella affigens TaxID=2021234 RepID=A0A2P1PP93_9GAMM|nr:TIGR03032 family protein [Ahniella affigens]AVP96663.1 TIGR03032 family protein [Ahniella affigens]
MQLDRPFVRLPIRFDAATLAQEVKALPEAAWRAHPQGYAGNSALPLIAAHGDPQLDRTKGPMRPTPWLAATPYLRDVLASLQSPIGRTRLMRIQGNGEAHAHVDTNYYWMTRYRVHVPIVTEPGVQFIVGKRAVNMAAGECWVFDTWSTHNVINTMPTERIHLVIDTIGGPAFKQWVDAGECPEVFNPPANPESRLIAKGHTQLPLALEHDNQPVVMSPFELRHWLNTCLSQLADPAQRPLLVPLLVRLDRTWAAWFAEHAALATGHAGFRQRLQEFDAALSALPKSILLRNGSDAVEFLRQVIVRVALNPELAWPEDQTAAFAVQDERQRPRAEAPTQTPKMEIAAPVPALLAAAPPLPEALPISAAAPVKRQSSAGVAPAYFDRPVFVVCPPRSGSSMLFEALCQSPEVLSIGGESHQIMEQIPGLNPGRVQFDSNRVDASAASAVTVAELTHGFFGQLRDRDGRPVRVDARRVRFVEKTPKNALRVSFLAAAYPDAHFVVLHREPHETISSMIDAWRSRRFVTYPRLPGWTGQPWSLLLTPGWREWNEKPLNEVAARQWAQTVRVLLDDLAQIPGDRVHVIRYQELLDAPEASLRRLCGALDLAWDRPIQELPPSKHTLTPHAKEKWRQNEALLREALPIAEPMVRRFADFMAAAEAARGPDVAPPVRARMRVTDDHATPLAKPAPAVLYGQAATAVAANTRPPETTAPKVAPEQAFGSVYTRGMAEILASIRSSVAVTTYQSGRVILLRSEGQGINTHFKSFPSPMGVAAQGDRLAIATARGLWEYHNQRGVAQALPPVGRHDACFVPRNQFLTGDIRVHEIAYTDQGLCVVNTRFSCLSGLDGVHSFVPRWQPKFITKLEATDRCHLNGLTVIDGKLRFVSCLAQTDTPGGWREHKADGGVIIDVASHECVATGLSMPHSPRWYQDRLWVLESGLGTLSQIDLATGRAHPFAELPGFVRGLAFVGPYALIGLSQIREGVFGGLPVMERIKERLSGVWVVDLGTARIAGFLRFEGQVQEIFDVALLPGLLFPELLEPEDERLQSSFVVPNGIAS